MKKSIIFGVLAMFAVSAMSIQNVNAQNGTTAKKEAVKQDSKQKPSKPTQAINEPKAKPQINQEDKTSKGAPIHKAKGNTSKNTMKKDGKMQKESNQQNVNVNGNGKTEGKAVKPGQKNDAKAEIKKEGQPAMRTAQPSFWKNESSSTITSIIFSRVTAPRFISKVTYFATPPVNVHNPRRSSGLYFGL